MDRAEGMRWKPVEQSLREAAEQVERRIAAACARAGRRRDEVRVIAVTKYVDAQLAEAAVDAGFPHLGENRWQDARGKRQALDHRTEIVWHFIGHLQTNKVKDVLGKFDMIHSLDRLSLAGELQSRAEKLGIVVPCFVQLNVSGEATKHGLPPDELFPFLDRLSAFNALDIAGLMTMAPHEDDPERTRPVFRRLRELMHAANAAGAYRKPLTELSMGMSNDFEIAVEEGATWVRLGSVLFGR